MSRADDRIHRLHPDHSFTLDASKLVHLCTDVKKPELGGWRHRDQLDPCAIGICRYCGEPLPLTPTEGHA